MSQAIYYEAAGEPPDGRRAVAQVVLNRVRHPAYPASVCGVVYQGSERTSGCQFSFTCDGSLRRTPAAGPWNEARRIAAGALGGDVFAPVGHATSYHADHVVPYWADSLDKEVQLGRHIFYRLRGGLGAARAFAQAYRGPEPSPLNSTDIALAATVVAGAAPEADSGLVPGGAGAAAPKPAPILADLSHGQLLADEDAAGSGLLGPPPGDSQAPPNPPAAEPDCPRRPASAVKAAPLDNRLGQVRAGDCR